MVNYCVAADVRRIINTLLSDVDVEYEIPIADAWINARGLSSLNTNILLDISRHLVAARIAMRDPVSGPVAEGQTTYRTPSEWIAMAEDLITRGQPGGGVAFKSYSEPID